MSEMESEKKIFGILVLNKFGKRYFRSVVFFDHFVIVSVASQQTKIEQKH